MHSYKDILIVHPVDESTKFLGEFEKYFKAYYFGFNSKITSINEAKIKLGDLAPPSLIVYVGHGSSLGLYEPDESGNYEKYFLDVTWGNHYFEDHDVILLSCKSSEYLPKLHKSLNMVGFGNIISSQKELDFHNGQSQVKKIMNKSDIELFNELYVDAVVKVLQLLIYCKIGFAQFEAYLNLFINKSINDVLKNKTLGNRIEIARLLFEFRNEIKVRLSN